MSDLFNQSGAHFSKCGKYRFCLYRKWDNTLPMVMFIGLNPSTADKQNDDPTIRRVIRFAKDWGFGGVYMLNLYAFITPYPKMLDTSGENTHFNDIWIHRMYWKSAKVICAWGAFDVKDRAEVVKASIPDRYALIINKDGSPRHPLYVPADTKPTLWKI